jgi:hydrogenase small subunit
MATAGEAADSLLRGWMTTAPAAGVTRVLIVEGSIPTNADKYCTISATVGGTDLPVSDAVAGIAAHSALVLAIGACAAFGGIPAANSDPAFPKTGAKDVATFLTQRGVGTLVVNVPGCPIHPDWLFGTIVHYLLGSFAGGANLDSYGRPVFYYGQTNHGGRCPRYQAYCDGMFALTPGEAPNENGRVFTAGLPSTGTGPGRTLGAPYNIPLCLDKLGCKGFSTGADCAFGGPGTGAKGRGWNVSSRGVDGNPAASCGNSCINNGHPCTGCTEKGYPDKYSPFFTY